MRDYIVSAGSDTDRDGRSGVELAIRPGSAPMSVLFAVQLYPAFGLIQFGTRVLWLWRR